MKPGRRVAAGITVAVLTLFSACTAATDSDSSTVDESQMEQIRAQCEANWPMDGVDDDITQAAIDHCIEVNTP